MNVIKFYKETENSNIKPKKFELFILLTEEIPTTDTLRTSYINIRSRSNIFRLLAAIICSTNKPQGRGNTMDVRRATRRWLPRCR